MIRIKSQIYDETRELEVSTTITSDSAESVITTYSRKGTQTLLSKKHNTRDVNIVSYLHDQMVNEL